MRPPSRATPVAGFALIPVIWGYNWIVLKKGLAFADPLAFSAWRFGIASACLFAVLALSRRRLRIGHLGAAAWVGLLQVTGDFGFAMWALSIGSAGRSVVLAYTMPFWVVLLARPLAGE